MHSTGFNFKNMPFWRTTLGFALGILASWSTVEMLRMSGFRPDGWPQWSLPAIYLFMTFVVTAVTSYMISHRYDYGICAKCGMRKNTWDSPLCGMCWDDHKLQQVKEEVPKLIEKFIKEEQDRDKERESHPPKLVCMICKSRLHWDVSWDAYICSEHGDIKTQSHHSRKEFIKEQIQFLENLTHIS
jgi:ribosomal protein L40E